MLLWNVTSAGCQVTLCDPLWHVSSRSGVATLRTAKHLLLTYLRYNSVNLTVSGDKQWCSVLLKDNACHRQWI